MVTDHCAAPHRPLNSMRLFKCPSLTSFGYSLSECDPLKPHQLPKTPCNPRIKRWRYKRERYLCVPSAIYTSSQTKQINMQFNLISFVAIAALLPAAIAAVIPVSDIAVSQCMCPRTYIMLCCWQSHCFIIKDAACNGANHYNAGHCCAYFQNGKDGLVISGGMCCCS